MTPLFLPRSNTVFRAAIALVGLALVAIPLTPWIWERTPYIAREQDPPPQPVKFDHRHHNRDDGIDCLYCHGDAQRGPYAGVPPTSLCMGCHAQIWPASPELALVRRSYFDDVSIEWQRVTRLPDFVFFDHSIHVSKGVGCVSCHGRVDLMPQVYAVQSLAMSWCLGCHRDPTEQLRPLDRITDMEWRADDPVAVGRQVALELGVRSITDCTGCHR